MLDKHLKSAPSPIYYIAGPPVMVNALQAMLQEAGIGHNDIRAEEFAGY
jgi:Na+-transporting NADH:ubiquinone oxidoreductase subunit NqrF